MQNRLTIGAVARRAGVPIKTICVYEARGIIPPAGGSDAVHTASLSQDTTAARGRQDR